MGSVVQVEEKKKGKEAAIRSIGQKRWVNFWSTTAVY
jgi:hypothetical protein